MRRIAVFMRDKQQWTPWVLWLLFALSLLLVFGEALYRHMELSANSAVLNDDARQQIVPFFRYEGPSLQHDYLGDYFLACLPIGYRALYFLGAKTIGAIALSKIVPYLLLGLTVAGVSSAAHRFGGKAGAWIAAALCLSSAIYLARLSGGLPRAFGFPILALGLSALVYGKLRLLAFLTTLAAGFYPVVTVMLGLSLAVVLLLPTRERGEASDWSFKRRLVFLAITTGAVLLIAIPQTLATRSYGSVITPGQIAEFPEVGPGGRYSAEDRAPFRGYFASAPKVVERTFKGAGKPIFAPLAAAVRGDANESRFRWLIFGVLALTALGWLRLAYLHTEARRVLVLFGVSVVGYSIASRIAPYFYLPDRYVAYAVPLLATLVVSVGAAGLVPRLEREPVRSLALPLTLSVVGLSLLLTIGGRGSEKAGLSFAYENDFYAFVRRLPQDSLLAGWPRGVMNNVPYVARRRALVNQEAYQAFHHDYALEMRRRTRAVIEAYFATDLAPLQRLREQYGVTHLVVERDVVRKRSGELFRPLDRLAASLARKSRGVALEVQRQQEKAEVFADGRVWILDLRRLQGPG